MKTYAELKAELNAAKKSIKEEIAAIIIQSPEPISAREIAAHLTGVTPTEVSAFLGNARFDIEAAVRSLGYRLYSKKAFVKRMYIAVDNPVDCLNISKELVTYYAIRI